MKRLITLVIVVLAAPTLVHAQQPQPAGNIRAGYQSPKAYAGDPAALVGLTKSQVEARLGKPSAGFATIWNYKQPKGTLHVRFRDGVVSDAQIDFQPRSSGKG